MTRKIREREIGERKRVNEGERERESAREGESVCAREGERERGMTFYCS